MNTQRIGLILLAGIALGSTASVIRVGVAEIHPILLVVFRFGVASLAFAVTLLVFRGSPDFAVEWDRIWG